MLFYGVCHSIDIMSVESTNLFSKTNLQLSFHIMFVYRNKSNTDRKRTCNDTETKYVHNNNPNYK